MTTDPVAEAELNDEATVFYEDTGHTGGNINTLVGKEFKIYPKEELEGDILLDHLTVEEAVYAFKTDACWIYVAMNDVRSLKTTYRGERLPVEGIRIR